MTRIKHNGKDIEAESISFTVTSEDWNSYQLHDGTSLRVRPILTNVFKVPNEYDQSGNPASSLNEAIKSAEVA